MVDNSFSKADFSRFLSEQKIMGSECTECGEKYLPPRPMCPACFSGSMRWLEVGTEGTLAAFSVVHIASTSMIEAGYGRENPHISGIVTLNDGLSISAQILGMDPMEPEKIKIGTPVKAVFLDRGEGEELETFLGFKLVS